MGGLKQRRNMNRLGAARLWTHNVLVNGLRFFWIVLVIWCEIGLFFYSLSSCRWPDKALNSLGTNEKPKPTHILLIADPQVRHQTIPLGATSWIGSLRRFLYDLYLKKGANVANRLHPHAVVFLGDVLASGRLVMSEEEYEQYYERFEATFPMESSTPVYHIPGNNDVGLGVSTSFSKNARRRWLKHFGAFNQEVTIRNHTFVFLDAPGLVEEDYQRAASGHSYDQWKPKRHGPVEFVNSVAAVDNTQPLILFSHIPLFRPDSKSCGPLREKGTIRRGVGHGYQNTLGKQTTAFLLKTLRPSAVFSADDRDYCEHVHVVDLSESEPDSNRTSPNEIRVREITVKSFSPARNIRRPGFQLLSLIPPPSPASQSTSLPALQTLADTPCSLPDQLGIFSSVYIPCIILSLLALIISHSCFRKRQLRLSSHSSPMPASPHLRSESPYNPSHPGSPFPGSALFSPFIPFTPTSGSHPRSPSSQRAFPSHLRTPSTTTLAAPALRASRPTTPHTDSPLLSPVILSHDEEYHEHDNEDAMYPTQYAVRRANGNGDKTWSHGDHRDEGHENDHHVEGGEGEGAFFLPAPGSKLTDRYRWSWSWSFVLRGRRRHMAIHLPHWWFPSSSWRSVSRRNLDAGMKWWDLVWAVSFDFISIMVPAGFVWGWLAWHFGRVFS